MRTFRLPDPLHRSGPRVDEPDGKALRRIVAELTQILQELDLADSNMARVLAEITATLGTLGTAAFVNIGTGSGDVPTIAMADARYVMLTTNQTIAGTKTFSAAVVLSTAGTATTHAVRADRTISAGTGLSGGGNLTANRTLSLDASSIASLALADTAVQPARTISAGTGLTGGGDLSANRTLSLSAASIASLALADTAVQPARTISAGTGLTGGGNLSADRTLSLSASSIASLALADTAVQPTRTLTAGDGLSGGGDLSANRSFAVDSTVVRTSRTLTAGDGLSGGGNLSANRTFTVDGTVVRTSRTLTAGDGLSGGGDLSLNRSFAVDGTVLRTAGSQQISKNAHASGASDYHLELHASAGTDEISLRFHKSASWWGQIRLRADGFHFTQGGDNTYRDIFANTLVLSTAGTTTTSAVRADRSISAGTGLTGGGNLTANRTLSLSAASIASLALADTAVQPSRTVTAGTGLTGGGALSSNITINLDLTYGAVGTYAFLGQDNTSSGNHNPGSSVAGSTLRPAGITASGTFNESVPTAHTGHAGNSNALTGTWRCMGMVRASAGALTGATLFVRIA